MSIEEKKRELLHTEALIDMLQKLAIRLREELGEVSTSPTLNQIRDLEFETRIRNKYLK